MRNSVPSSSHRAVATVQQLACKVLYVCGLRTPLGASEPVQHVSFADEMEQDNCASNHTYVPPVLDRSRQ